ncbi:Chitin-binding protein [Phytophthora palmivora]|uniref:Chitin-binding protein n=1 Tax=Phytophthora palmivora TaxID=4796 RepID=A0A2P4YIT8_9STRA|nr:Chitin-binding protein [Phytophthora palmivora]
MQPTGIVSLAVVATAAALFTTADAHGQMLVPAYRQISAKFRKDSGALNGAGDQELQYAPVENLSGRSQKDFPEAATFNLMNGCRGTVYEQGNNVTTLQPGADFDVKWIIQAPHPGTMKLSVVKPSKDSAGKITYENYKTIKTVDPFAQNGGEGSTTATMPTDVTGCDSAGDCALQFYWHSDIANQTYPTCADIIVSGSGGASTTTKRAIYACHEHISFNQHLAVDKCISFDGFYTDVNNSSSRSHNGSFDRYYP